MTPSAYILLLGSVCMTGRVSAAGGLGNDLELYSVGNSLIRGISQDRLKWLFEQAGGRLGYGSQGAANATLHEHWFQARAECVRGRAPHA